MTGQDMIASNFGSGILADHQISSLIEADVVTGAPAILPDQVQPASLDLRLGTRAYRLRASFLPNGRKVEDCLTGELALHELDISKGAVLETGCIYLIPLAEWVRLPEGVTGLANPKSSTGRIDVFVRLITDGAQAFDQVPEGYEGPLYAEVSPRTFSILVTPGERLLQLRLRKGPHIPSRSVDFSINLQTGSDDSIIGYRARRHGTVLDLKAVGQHDPKRFWEAVHYQDDRLILDPDEFYILASREKIEIPLGEAAEMAPIAPELGEFRAHYAGFFDPGFGVGGETGKAVLEVRGRDVPFILEHGQPVGRLVYEAMSATPEKPYGQTGSHYQGQRLKLSKHFGTWS